MGTDGVNLGLYGVDGDMKTLDFILANSPRHLDLVRSKPCAVASQYCWGDVVACHLVTVKSGNSRKKPSFKHYSTVPLCVGHHQEQEKSTREFNYEHNIDLGLYALQLSIESWTGVEACWHNDRGKIWNAS